MKGRRGFGREIVIAIGFIIIVIMFLVLVVQRVIEYGTF